MSAFGTDPRGRRKASLPLSVFVGLTLFLMLLALLVLSAGFDASKFIYVDF